MPTVHPLPVNPTTGQQPLASLRSFSGSTHHHHSSHLSGSAGGVNREVLKQLQDVAWSDEEDDPDCMVCAEPLDLSDQNFKPCQCGLQICQFCYNKLLRDDPRCPGCRRKYDSESVVFQPVDFDEVRRVKEKKAKRAKVCKQLDSMGRRQYLDTRIVMKNSVYVVGMKIPGSGSHEEAVSILRSNDYFGQYGKISRIFLRDRAALSSTVTHGPSPDSPSTATGIYIVYVRREDAARAISSLDGIPAPQGPPGQVLHASYGTTRYCDSFLRAQKCDNAGCQNLHEWGGEGDTFSRNDLEIALTRPAEYDARQLPPPIQPPPLTQKSAWPKPSVDDVDSSALPRTANWGMRPLPRSSSSSSARGNAGAVGSQRPTKIQSTLIPLGGRSTSAFPPPQASQPISITTKADKEKKRSQTMARGRSDLSASTNSGHTSPKKKPLTVDITSSIVSSPVTMSAANSPKVPISINAASSSNNTTTTSSSTTSTTPVPATTSTTAITSTSTNPSSTSPSPPATTPASHPPGIAPPPGLGVPESAPVSPVKTTTEVPVSLSPVAPSSPVKTFAPEPEPPAQPEAGPSTYAIKPKQLQSTEYPIHSPYPDFDDVFMEPDAAKIGFAFSWALDDEELQRLLALSHEVGGFEAKPFDPLFEELPKLGIPLASLMAAHPRESAGGPYSGPFSPFAPSSPIETSSQPTSEEPSLLASSASEADFAPRTASRFEFARRGSMASTGRGQSPFHGRDDWGRAPSSNGYGGGADDMRAAIAAAKAAQHGYHPALVHLNSHVAAAAAAAGANAGSSDSWSNGGGEYQQLPQQNYRSYPRFGSSYYGSPQIEGMGPSPGPGSHGNHGHSYGPGNASSNGPSGPAPHAPPGYESYSQGPASPQVYGQMGYVQQRRY